MGLELFRNFFQVESTQSARYLLLLSVLRRRLAPATIVSMPSSPKRYGFRHGAVKARVRTALACRGRARCHLLRLVPSSHLLSLSVLHPRARPSLPTSLTRLFAPSHIWWMHGRCQCIWFGSAGDNDAPQAREEVEAKTVAGILTLVERERTGVDINRPLLRSLLRMLSALGVSDQRDVVVLGRIFEPWWRPRVCVCLC